MEPSDDVLRALLGAAPDALLAVDAAGTIVYANDQAEHLFGWARADLVGQQVERLVPERFAAAHPDLRAGYLEHPTTRPMGAGLELSARRADGSEFPAEISLSAVTDDPGSLLVLAAVRDVTDRVELEAERQRQALAVQREQSHRLESLGQLAGGVAHDFNNLLGVILNYASLLSSKVTDPEDVADLGEIRAAAERGAGLTRQLLTFARRDVANPESLEINEVVRGVASMLDRTLGEDIELRLHLCDAPLVAVADRHQLEQIVLNLAINARDAMPDGGRLSLTTRPEPGRPAGPPRVVLEVTDTGHGMPAAVLSHAFEPFYSTKPRGKGTGLGLATVYGIVSRHHGQVSIDSTEGVGTTVTVVLRGSRVEPAGTIAAEASEGGHERILVVEDEEPLRTGTARILRTNGYEVLLAEDGIEALEVFEREGGAVDLVVSDVAMPRMRGDELARLLAEHDPDLPVVFMSGYDSGDAPLTGRLLAKPVAAAELLRAVREVLDG